MARKNFIFHLFNADKKPLYVDDMSGTVLTGNASTLLRPDGTPVRLKHSPDGWRDTLVKFARNIKYFGLFRDFTAPMTFRIDGKKIVSNSMWRFGMDVVVYFTMSKLNRMIFPEKYETWYVGELDFSKYDQKKNEVKIQVVEGGLSKLFKAFESITYEIPVDEDPEAIPVLMDGFPFSNKISYEIFAGQDIPRINAEIYRTIGMGTTVQEGSTQGILNLDSPFANLDNNNNFMVSDTKTVTVTFSGSISFHVDYHAATRIHVAIRLVSLNSVITDYTLINADYAADSNSTVSFSQILTLVPGDKLYFINISPAINGVGEMYSFTAGFMNVNYEVTFAPTVIKALPCLRLFQKLVEKMTGGIYTGSSTFLASLIDIVVTSGSAIRNHEGQAHTVSGSLIKTSISDFFKSFNHFQIGLGIKDSQLIIEKLEYFFQNGIQTLTLGEVNELSITVAEDLCFNTIKVGQNNQTYDSVNGLDEFNVIQNYTTPHLRTVKEYDLISPYRADMYGIELMRLNLAGKDTTDNSSDNDTFLLSINGGAPVTGDYQAYTTIAKSYSVESNIIYQVHAGSNFTANTLGDIITYTGVASSVNIHLRFKLDDGGTGTKNVQIIKNDTIVIGSLYAAADHVTTWHIDLFSSLAPGDTLRVFVADFGGVDPYFVLDSYLSITTSLTPITAYTLKRPSFTSITGLKHPAGAFNIDLSPKQALLNNGPFFRSILDKSDDGYIQFQSGEKNSSLSRTIGGVTVSERSDVQIGTLGTKLFLPYYFSFSTTVPLDFMSLIKTNPYGKVTFSYRGNSYYGFLFDGGVKPATNDKQTWKLLAGPDNDMTKLINEI